MGPLLVHDPRIAFPPKALPMAPSILLIDNDQDSLNIYTLILRHHGYRVIVARDATSGLQQALEGKADVVISENFLPELGTSTLLENLRSNHRTQKTPMIVLDSTPNRAEKLADPHGRSSSLTKPCEPSRLLSEVQRWLRPVEMAV